MPDAIDLSSPFNEAIDYLKRKINLPSRAWTDLKEGAHARSFVVAGAMRDKLVSDFHGALVKAMQDGTTLIDFQNAFDAIVARHGWDFKGGRTWRARVIYDTNLRMAHAAGKWAQIERVKNVRPYLRYIAVHDTRTRPEHVAWHGTILPVDDGWWKTHYPPNGWNCRCTVQSLSKRDLIAKDLNISPPPDLNMENRAVETPDGVENWPTPTGIDTGFGYNVGQSWLSGAVPPPLAKPLSPPTAQKTALKLPPLPEPTPVMPSRILPAGLKAEDYARAFLAEFGADIGRPAAYRDVAGHALAIGEELFKDHLGQWKILKWGRERYMVALADALKDPDEIWVDWFEVTPGRFTLRRRYIKTILADERGGLAVFEWSQIGWSGTTVFAPDARTYLDRQRHGALLYSKKRAEK